MIEVIDDENAPQTVWLWSPNTILWTGLLLTPISGGALAGMNAWRMGRRTKMWQYVISSLMLSFFLFSLRLGNAQCLTLIISIGFALSMRSKAIDDIEGFNKDGNLFRYGNSLLGFGLGLLVSLALMATWLAGFIGYQWLNGGFSGNDFEQIPLPWPVQTG